MRMIAISPVRPMTTSPAAVMMMTESRGASNAKAKAELGWQPSHPSWRKGFVPSAPKTKA